MTTENHIEALAARAQQLPPDIRWIAGNMQGWIQAAGMSVEPKRGPWELRSWRLMRLAGWLRLERPLSFLVNLLLLAGLYASQFRVRGARPAPSPLFIGIDALREPDMIRRFSALQGGQAVSIDGRGVAGFLPYGRVGVLDLCRALLDARRGVWRHLSEWEPLTGIGRLNAINFLMLRGHQYAYFYAWFRQYLSKPGVSPVVAFTAVNSPAYAAVAAGAQTVYMLHGFQRHSIVYPDFARCVSITAVEAGHLRRRLPNCEVSVVGVPLKRFDTRRAVAVAGIFWKPDGFDRVRPFIEWARSNDLPVVVRPHPVDTSGYWEQWRGVSGVEIVEDGTSFEAFLEAVRPRFLATWYSTVLFDALASGVVPITVCPDSAQMIDTVYPVRELAICWPDQEALAQVLIDDDRARADYLTRLFELAMDEPGRRLPQAAPAA